MPASAEYLLVSTSLQPRVMWQGIGPLFRFRDRNSASTIPMNATTAISATRAFIFLMAAPYRACIRSRSFLQSRINDIHKSVDAQGNMDLLAVDEKRRHCFDVGLSRADHILNNPVPKLGRTHGLHEGIGVQADTAGHREKLRFRV